MTPDPHPTVAVWWTDAEGIDHQTTRKDWGPLPVWVTRGLLVEDGDVVTVAGSWCPANDEYDNVTRIPRVLIHRMVMYVDAGNTRDVSGNGQVLGEDRAEGSKA